MEWNKTRSAAAKIIKDLSRWVGSTVLNSSSLELGLQDKGKVLAFIACLISLIVAVVQKVWVCDDAYITFRVVENFLDGYGLRWNPIERVQVFTHPLWLLVLSAADAIVGAIHFTSIFVSVIFTAGTFYLLCRRATILNIFLLTSMLIFSKSFIEYSTSGLENPLSMFLLSLFFVLLSDAAPQKENRLFFCSLVACMAILNRMDTILFYVPTLLWLWWSSQNKIKSAFIMVLAFTPFIVWELFSIVYYGFWFPNTAYAKLNLQIPRTDLLLQGIVYAYDSILRDPVTLTFTTISIIATLVLRTSIKHKAFSVGMVMYLLYVISIGGCFMSGRFFSVPFVGAVMLIGSLGVNRQRIRLGILALIIVVGLTSSYRPFVRDVKGKGGKSLFHGIASEWHYYGDRGFFRNTQARSLPLPSGDPLYLRGLKKAEQAKRIANKKRLVFNADRAGTLGFAAGPAVHVMDRIGLTDALIARLPQVYNPKWRPGHTTHVIPKGYIKTLEKDVNLIADPDIAKFYQKLSIVIREPSLWRWDRFVEIYRFNMGHYDYLVEKDELVYLERKELSLKEVSQPATQGSSCSKHKGGCKEFGNYGILVTLGDRKKGRIVQMSLNAGKYTLFFYNQREKVGAVEFRMRPQVADDGVGLIELEAPKSALEKGYDAIFIRPGLGSGKYLLGHVKMQNEETLAQQPRVSLDVSLSSQ